MGRAATVGGGQVVAFGVDMSDDAAEPAWEPPGGSAKEGHDRGYEGGAHDEGVDEDADGEGERDGL